ncbi:hypothetical protein DM860_012560 [Cuscuta australis]|uniref:Uncharacterized protein n=1 Tax=Cuscuta australis TaxID=267555 RepID=A0A328DGP0_9ASTE|nr:hypothetical protein DM860_012560 [Cuscuta australis]
MAEEKKRTINLFCPSLSKLVPVVAWEDERIDLGHIARTFGIEPATLKLNGHFISRGVDLIASSVTWKSLLSFFSARGFSTGASHSDALTVDGKLSKLGTKRGAHIPLENEIQSVLNPQCIKLISPKRIKDGSRGSSDFLNRKFSQLNSLGLKRKLEVDGGIPVKRTRTNECNPDIITQRGPVFANKRERHLPCSLDCDAAKQRKEDENMGVSSPLKRIRNY